MRYLNHKPKSVALVCMGPSATDFLTRTLTQEYDPNWVDEVWCINMAANPFRCDLVFWMDDLVEQEKFRPKLFVALRKFGVNVITSVSRPEIVPNSYDYPLEPIAQMAIPVFGKPYLNNGVAMAVAYALLIGVENMHIFGADFSYPNRDYAESGRACVESWLTLAGMRGMNISLCPNTSLMDSVKDHGIYGYAEQPEVKLPDGRMFKYVKARDVGKYIPEDSSGVKNELPAPNPGAGGNAPVDAGRSPDGEQAAGTAPAPVGGSRKSLRSGDTAPREYEKQNLALHDSGGRSGDVSREAREPVLPAPRPTVPRHEAL